MDSGIRILNLAEIEAVAGGMTATMELGSMAIVVEAEKGYHCVGVVKPGESVTTCHY